eukprot:m.35150 g.35150  ORF g.35150 m.35150 type:complete len:539 (-) comp12370_c0_seq1:1077-2693(-)
MSLSGKHGDSGVDVLSRPSRAPEKPGQAGQRPSRPPRRSLNRPESGVYGFFNQSTNDALAAGAMQGKPNKAALQSLTEESSPDWEFVIEEDLPVEQDAHQALHDLSNANSTPSVKHVQPSSTQRVLHQPSSRQSTPSPSFTFVPSRNAEPPTALTLPTPDKGGFSFVQGHATSAGGTSPESTPRKAVGKPSSPGDEASIPPPAAFAGTSTAASVQTDPSPAKAPSSHAAPGAASPSSTPNLPTSNPTTPSVSHSRPSRTISTAERLDQQRQAAQSPNTPDAIVSRRGTVVSRKGAISDLRARFGKPSPSPQRERGSSAQMVDVGDGFSSRRGSVLLKKGVVGRFKGMFHKKAHDLTTPKSQADILAEKEAAAGAKTGGKLVLYTTSGTTVRATYAACQMVLRLLQGHRCKYEERDVMLSRAFASEVKERCPATETLPQLFLNGKRIGGAETIEHMNENGSLPMVLKKVPKYQTGEGPCDTCAGRFFIPCEWCGGDRKSVMSRFGTELVKLKCTVCNEQGLQKCPVCQQAQALEEASEA